MNREPLSQSTDKYSPLLMSVHGPQHSGELTHFSHGRRKCKQRSLREGWLPAEVPEKHQGEAVWEESSSACPGDSIAIILLFLSALKITSKHVESYQFFCFFLREENLLREAKITKDMNILLLL